MNRPTEADLIDFPCSYDWRSYYAREIDGVFLPDCDSDIKEYADSTIKEDTVLPSHWQELRQLRTELKRQKAELAYFLRKLAELDKKRKKGDNEKYKHYDIDTSKEE